MAAARVLPSIHVQPDYETWVRDLDLELACLDMDRCAWQVNWAYNFRRDYNLGVSPHEAAIQASDYWWQRIFDESWI